jgi:hypothetical protein
MSGPVIRDDLLEQQRRLAALDLQKAAILAQQVANPKSVDYAALRDLSLASAAAAMKIGFMRGPQGRD